MMTHNDLHPSEHVATGVCDNDDFCITPGVRRKLNVHHDQVDPRNAPILAICKGCARRSRKSWRAFAAITIRGDRSAT